MRPRPRIIQPDVLSRAEITQGATELLDLVDHLRQALDSAIVDLNREQVRHGAAQRTLNALLLGTHDAPGKLEPGDNKINLALAQLASSNARLDFTRHRTRTASRSLQRIIHGTDLMHLTTLSQMADQAEQSKKFSQQRLADLETRIRAIRSNAGDRLAVIEVELKLRSEEAQTLMALDHDLALSEKILIQAENRLNRLSAQLATLAGPQTDSSTTSRRAAALLPKIKRTQAIFDRATAEQQRCQHLLQHVDIEFATLNQQIGGLMQERVQEDRRWHAAQRSAAPLEHTSKFLAAQSKEAEANVKAEAQEGAVAEGSTEAGHDRDAFAALHQRFIANQTEVAHAFGPHASVELKAALEALSARVSLPSSPTPLPAVIVSQIVTTALARVTRHDPERAARALNVMKRYPALHWITLATERSSSAMANASSPAISDATLRDVIALSRKMATLPRGADLLHLLSSEGAVAPDSEKSVALRAFWNADKAQQEESDPSVASWLQQAKRVARATLSPEVGATLDDVDYAAYNAVCNGNISNAQGSPYAEHDQRLKKAITEWVIRATASDAGAGEDNAATQNVSRWRRLIPNLNKTPYAKRTLNRGYEVGESMGMQSPRMGVDRAVKRQIAELERIVAAYRQHDGAPEREAAAVAAQAVVDHLKMLEKRGHHLSQVKLQSADAKTIRQRIGAEAHQRRLAGLRRTRQEQKEAGTGGVHGLLLKAAPVDLPKLFADTCGCGLSAYEALNRITEHLQKIMPAEVQANDAASPNVDDDFAAAVRLLKSQRFADKTDIVAFFKPFILQCRLRDRLRLGGGGILGGGLPSLPYGSASPIASPIFTAEMSRGDEAFVQLFMPILGMEMSFGRTRTTAMEATGGVAAGPQLAPGMSLQGTFSARFASEKMRTDSTVIRFLRKRHQDDEMRQNMLNALDSLVRWDLIEPQQGRRFDGPLEALLARNPKVAIAQVEAVTQTQSITARVSARLPFARLNDPSGTAQTLGVEPSLFASAERVRDRRTERGGTTHIAGSRGDTTQQRAGVGLAANAAPLSNQAVLLGHAGQAGEVQRESLPLQLGATREIAWAMEKHEISPFLIDDKQDADLDRHSATPAQMLAEIAGNRENWIMRCVETLEPDHTGQKDTPDNKRRAAILLHEFEQDIEKLGKTSRYCQFNVNYSMKAQHGAWIDGYRALAELASQHGDAEGVRNAQQAIDDILLMRGTWRPLMLIVRERARDSSTRGWRSLLRWQRISNVDGQRTAAQFPPP